MSRKLLFLVTIACGCADLESLELDRCDNGVLEPARGEDCDSHAIEPSTRCAASGEAHECRYVCTQPGTGEGCPTGWRCGADGVCRAATGTLATDAKVLNQPVGFWMELADMDGNWHADLVTVHRDHAAAGYLEDAELRQTFEIPINTIGLPILAEASGDALPDLLLPTVPGLSTLRASTDRRLVPTSYASIALPGTPNARFFSVDVLPDVIVGLGYGALFAGEELLAITPGGIAGGGANWYVNPSGAYDLDRMLPPAVGDMDEISETSSPYLPPGSETPHEIALAAVGDMHITVLRPTLALATDNRIVLALDSSPVTVTLDGPVLGGLLAVQLNPPVGAGGESALPCSPTTRVPGDMHLDLLVGIEGTSGDHSVVAAYGLGDGRFHSVPCELDAVIASTIPANGGAAPVDWLPCPTPLLAAGQIDDDGVLDVAGEWGLWLTKHLADPFVGVCEIAAPHVAQVDVRWKLARIAELDGRPPADVVGARSDGGFDVLLGSTDAPHTITHVPTLVPVSEMSVADLDANGAEDVAFIERFGTGGDTLSLLFGELYSPPSAPVTLGASGQMVTMSTFDSTVIGDIVPDDASEIALAVRHGDALDMALLWGRSDRQIHAPFLMSYADGAIHVALGGAVGRAEIDGDPATSERALFAVGTNMDAEVVFGAGVIKGESHIALAPTRLDMMPEVTDGGIGMLAIDHDDDGEDTPLVLVYSVPNAANIRLYAPMIGANDWSLAAPLTMEGVMPLGVPNVAALGQLSIWSPRMSPSVRTCRLGEPAVPTAVMLMLEQTACATGTGNTATSIARLFDPTVVSSIAAGNGGAPATLAAPPGEAMLAIDCLQADTDVGDELVVLTISPPPPSCEADVEAYTSLKIYLTEVDGSGMGAPAVELDAGAVPGLAAENRTRPPVSGIATGDVNGDGVDDVAVGSATSTLILLGKPTNP